MSYLTDDEHRILLAALRREKEVCQKVDDTKVEDATCKMLVPIVNSLEKKFYHDRFEKEIRDKAIEQFVSEAMKRFTEFDLKHGYPTVTDCKIILQEIAEDMKEVGE